MAALASKTSDKGLTLTVLGCGTMGIAILSGILASLSDLKNGNSSPVQQEELPARLPARFIACVRRSVSAKRIRTSLGEYSSSVEVFENRNLDAVKAADVVLLACKPQMFREILSAQGVKEALEGKLLLSILAGVPAAQIEEHLYGNVSETTAPEQHGRCRVVRALPNTAAGIRESMTVIATSTPSLPPPTQTLVTWLFNSIGRVTYLPPNMLDVSTALCGSGPAFIALVLEALADGAVAMGMPRAEAGMMAAQVMRGTTGMVLNGEHPAILRDKVSTPGGCTIGGLLVLEEGSTKGTMARAIRQATVVASQLGQGQSNVNGPRL